MFFSTQDDEFVRILEHLQNELPMSNNPGLSDESRIISHFCFDTIFNLRSRVLSENEIKIFKKGLDFTDIQRKVKKPELKQGFEKFCRRMQVKSHFRNKPSK